MLDVVGGLRASSDPIAMLDAEGLALLRQCLEISTPDRPLTLTESFGGAVTHFTRATFNLTDSGVRDLPAHGAKWPL